jgi:secreted trypsin-like serine protease
VTLLGGRLEGRSSHEPCLPCGATGQRRDRSLPRPTWCQTLQHLLLSDGDKPATRILNYPADSIMPVELSDYIQPIRLASTNLPNSAAPTAIGWGQTSDADPELSSGLNYVGLAVLSNAECKITYGNQITDDMVCVEGNYNEGSCIGDSGSPLVVRLIGGQFLQHVGVSTFFSGNGCESTDPSGYTRTYPYVDWIKNVTSIE